MLGMVCFRQQHVVMHFETTTRIERGIKGGHPHFCTACNEEHLVFSGSPYRLAKPTDETLDELKKELPERMDKLFAQTAIFLSEAERLIKEQSSNLAALMLHQCAEYLFKNILYDCTSKFYNNYHIAKLHAKVEKFLPQVGAQLSEGAIDALDNTRKWLTAPLYSVDEVWDAESVFDEVNNVLKVTKTVFEKRAELLSGDRM